MTARGNSHRWLSVTVRDRAILAQLAEHEPLTTGELRLLFFTGVRTCRARLKVLEDAGLLVRVYPARTSRGGKSEPLWFLSAQGRRAIEEIRSLRQAREGRGALPRLCVKPDEAAQMLSVSRDYFDEHVKPELKIVHHGTRTVLVPVTELVRWVDRNAARGT